MLEYGNMRKQVSDLLPILMPMKYPTAYFKVSGTYGWGPLILIDRLCYWTQKIHTVGRVEPLEKRSMQEAGTRKYSNSQLDRTYVI